MPFSRLSRAMGALLIIAAITTTGATPAGAEPVRGPKCPENRAQLAGQHITSLDGLPDLTCADLHDAVLDGLDLGQEDLSGVDAHGASFRDADLVQATLTGANLRGAHFDGADLSQADLDAVDARDATFTEADLSQAELTGADLRGADFTSASLTQADLVRADLRGARTVFAEAIQADTDGAKVDVLDPRTFQASLIAILVGLALLVKSLIDVVRGNTPGDRAINRGLSRLAIYAVVNVMLWVFAGMLLPLMYIVVLYPLLVGALLVYLSGAVRGYRPARFGRPDQDPFPVGLTIRG
ncbi:pentapeptide repeat-containing protein [Dactylosporangium aurantiacum]|uniref:Pentapeptide repeat-containing protein n=1 Tax=Dactylosporangium aurantiacum TaxID=35754 RepID=A0A9Q9ILA7_9ACTN|nr:pentapeptide repeat-containing protein [Dactylosporangium aurantiacum]MDG6103153.1 pentapeptide repeat-containing protein [Dactylosporangium aurantiacum]UWZ57661.1 pentapeptide repeat-containing protein [Dactylosporangium aurantiacum]